MAWPSVIATAPCVTGISFWLKLNPQGHMHPVSSCDIARAVQQLGVAGLLGDYMQAQKPGVHGVKSFFKEGQRKGLEDVALT